MTGGHDNILQDHNLNTSYDMQDESDTHRDQCKIAIEEKKNRRSASGIPPYVPILVFESKSVVIGQYH